MLNDKQIMKKQIIYVFIGLLFLCGGVLLTGQYANAVGTTSTISGRITDSNNNGIIVKAELVQGNIAYHVSSNQNGDYSVTIPNGVYTLKFSDFNQTIPNVPAYYQVEKTITISNTNTVDLTIPTNVWHGSGLRDSTNSLYNGMIQVHVPLNVAGYSGMSGDLTNVVNGAFTFKLLPTQSNFVPVFAGDNMGINSCVVSTNAKTITC